MEAETDIDSDARTGLFPVMSKLIRDEGEKLRREKVTPWAFFHADKVMRVTDFYGKEIICAGSGVTFDGSPRTVFWGRYIEPFLEEIVLRMLDRTVAFCREEGHDTRPALIETGRLLKRLIRETYDAMADIDQRLRGLGYPDRVARRNVSGEIDALERFSDARLTGLIAVAKPTAPPQDVWQVVLLWLWRWPPFWRGVSLTLIVAAVLTFALWVSLPEKRKDAILDTFGPRLKPPPAVNAK